MDEDDVTHSLPIGQMGNYQDYLKKMPVPLREIESQPVRQHMFGNPFKINKNMILDEVVDEVPGVPGMAGGMSPGSGKGVKRQAATAANQDLQSPFMPKRPKKGKRNLFLKTFSVFINFDFFRTLTKGFYLSSNSSEYPHKRRL